MPRPVPLLFALVSASALIGLLATG
jgi:hypothetical protein